MPAARTDAARIHAARPPRGEPRRPAVTVAAALAAGILLDRVLAPSALWPLAVGGAALAAAFVSPAVRRFALPALIAAAGAVNHQAAWRAVPAGDVSRRVGDEATLARLTGRLVGDPRTYEKLDRPAWEDPRRAVAELECESLEGDAGPVPVTGRVRLYVEGAPPAVRSGDRVRALGWLGPVRGPTNPGQWDRRADLRRKGVRCEMSAPADVVTLVDRGWRLTAPVEALRARCAERFASLLPDRAAAVAKALLLGERGDLTREDRRRFVASGTMHLLAISGLHVGLLAWFVLTATRPLPVPPGARAAGVVAVVAAFALLAESRPPVLRAVLFVAVAAAAMAARRRVDVLNVLCVAAAVVLTVTPAALFEVGTQLSFLAVAGLEWGRRVLPGPPDRLTNRLLRGAWEGYRITAGIWLFTGPVAAAAFGVLSPVGFALNVVLLPPFAAVLGCGFLTLAAVLFVPAVAWAPAAPFGLGLSALLWLVDAAAAVPGGHLNVPPPPVWWLVGWYAPLLGSLLVPGRYFTPVVRAGAVAGVVGWLAAGLLAPHPLAPGALRVTVLDVGHGSAVLLELPDGGTLLYDCGSLSGGDRAADAVAGALRARGRNRVDAVLLSHADADHFNGLPGLLQTARVDAVLLGPHFSVSRQRDAVAVEEELAARGVPVVRVSAGMTLRAGGAALTVLHPPPGPPAGGSDNDRSVVVLVDYAGRRVLLTGDLEGPPQTALAAAFVDRYGPGVDVLLAPHHGGRRANAASLGVRLGPRVVIASGGRHADAEHLAAVYADADFRLTERDGAVTATVSADGRLAVASFLPAGSPDAGSADSHRRAVTRP